MLWTTAAPARRESQQPARERRTWMHRTICRSCGMRSAVCRGSWSGRSGRATGYRSGRRGRTAARRDEFRGPGERHGRRAAPLGRRCLRCVCGEFYSKAMGAGVGAALRPLRLVALAARRSPMTSAAASAPPAARESLRLTNTDQPPSPTTYKSRHDRRNARGGATHFTPLTWITQLRTVTRGGAASPTATYPTTGRGSRA
jgi:hypothetical protein